MENQTIDLKQVLGIVAEYDNDQKLLSPDKPFEVKATFFPGAASNIHTHPFQDEYYKVHQGEIELYMDGRWKPLKAGEEAFIPRNAVHGFRNTSSLPAHLTNIHTLGLQFGASLVAMESLVKEKNLKCCERYIKFLNGQDTTLLNRIRKLLLGILTRLSIPKS